MKIIFTSLLLFSMFLSESQTYTIDASHSNVQINVERFGVVDVSGRFKAVSGSITYDETNTLNTKASATILVESYDANNIGGESAVKSKVFLDVENFPEIKFESKEVIVKDDQHFLRGELTIHGITNLIELPYVIKGPSLDLPTQKNSIAFKASITIDRQNYGISFDRKLPNGISIVGNEIDITLMILAIAE